MKFFLISDDADTCVGLRLAGVDVALVHDRQRALEVFDKVEADDSIGILFVTSGIRAFAGERIDALTAGGKPVVMEIPDSSGQNNSNDAVGAYIRATVGINV